MTVIPTAQSGGGPFRADGSPDDGWAVPGARDELVKMVQACRGAVDGSVGAARDLVAWNIQDHGPRAQYAVPR